eukprot:1142264-Pelagomonas_calceolata.AAC.4
MAVRVSDAREGLRLVREAGGGCQGVVRGCQGMPRLNFDARCCMHTFTFSCPQESAMHFICEHLPEKLRLPAASSSRGGGHGHLISNIHLHSTRTTSKSLKEATASKQVAIKHGE